MLFTLIYRKSYLCSHWYHSYFRVYTCMYYSYSIGCMPPDSSEVNCSIMKKKDTAKNLRLKHLPHKPRNKPHPLLALPLLKHFLRAWILMHLQHALDSSGRFVIQGMPQTSVSYKEAIRCLNEWYTVDHA